MRLIAYVAVAWAGVSIGCTAVLARLAHVARRHNEQAAANALGLGDFDFGPGDLTALARAVGVMAEHEVPEHEVRELVMAIEVLRVAESVDDLAYVGGWLE